MKFHWFAQEYYTKLPEGYPGKDLGSWVDAPYSVVDPAQVGEDYHLYISAMQQADKLGWDSLLLNEHHQSSLAMTPSPNIIAAALASTTENSAIALCGNSLALYNPPIRVAEEMAMLDAITGGRMISGMVFGTPMDTAWTYGVSPIELRDRFHEAHDLIKRAWKQDEPPFSFNGKYTQLPYVNLWPRPTQKNIPVWVPGSGSIETWEFVNKHDYCYGYLSFSGRQSAQPIVNAFWDYTEKTGGDMNPNRMAFTQMICVADTDAEAERLYEDAVKYFYRMNPVRPEFGNPPGYNSLPSLRATLERERVISAEERQKASTGQLSFWEYDELGYIIAGTPERVEQRLRELATDLRIGQLITCMHYGNLSKETTLMNNQLFGEKVAPKLRDVWADFEDRWTPEVTQKTIAEKFPGVNAVANA